MKLPFVIALLGDVIGRRATSHYVSTAAWDRRPNNNLATLHRRRYLPAGNDGDVFNVPTSPNNGGYRIRRWGRCDQRRHRRLYQTVKTFRPQMSFATNRLRVERRRMAPLKSYPHVGLTVMPAIVCTR